MKRAALLVAILATTSSVASAGTYVGLGIGTNALSEDSDRLVEDGRSARLIVGYRFKPMKHGAFAVEGSLGGYGVGLVDRNAPVKLDAYQLSAAVRFNLPIADNFEAFGRLGLHHTTVGGENAIYDTSGNGFLVGLGMAYKLDLSVGKGAWLTVDYQLNKTQLTGERFQGESALDVLERQWTLGAAFAF
jgi:hypothetical protein